MVERICPSCQHGNPLDDHFCGKCGSALVRQLPARREDTRLTVAGRQLPVTWQQFGKTMALSVAALAAEAGLAWLRRRVDSPGTQPTSLARTIVDAATAPKTTALAPRPSGSVVTIVSERLIEMWESSDGHRHVSERHVWRRTED